MELEVGETQLRVRLWAGGAAVAVTEAEAADVKRVRVKGRLMRVQKERAEIAYAVGVWVKAEMQSWSH